MTAATPQGQGKQTQPMAVPRWLEVAGGWPSGRAERGPYADADTIEAGVDWADAARHPGGPLLAWLWGEQGQAGEYLLASNSVTVGRDPGSDVVLPEPSVSHAHAKIEYCAGQWWLQPVDSGCWCRVPDEGRAPSGNVLIIIADMASADGCACPASHRGRQIR
jgi:hypothetical protein